MRIPFALQTVFLQSQAGEDVEKIEAPAGGVSSKAYPPIVPKARASDVSHNNNKASATPQKIGYKPVTSRQTAMSLKIFSRLSKKMTTAADATKSKLWHKKKSTDAEGASKEEWVSTVIVVILLLIFLLFLLTIEMVAYCFHCHHFHYYISY